MDPTDQRLESRIRRLRPVLLTLAEALIAPAYRVELDASDLVQQTLLEAHHEAQLLDSFDDGPFFGWLREALHHNVLDAVKNLKTQKKDVRRRIRVSDIDDSFARLEEILVADDTSPSEIVQRNEQTALLLGAIQELADNQRQAVILKHLQGYSLKQVAEKMGLSEAATAGLLHRGRKHLAERLEQQIDE